jgi:hypothetical protein
VPAVNTFLFHRRRAERFAQLLDEAHGGRRHHARSPLDAQLSELVAISHQASVLPTPAEVDPEFRSGLRELLMATAERDGIGRTAQPAAAPQAVPAPRRAAGPSTSTLIRARGAVIVSVVVGAIAVSGMSAASEHAVPGDALYSVKRSAERAQLALASSDVTRGQLYLDFAHTRIGEALAVRRDSNGFRAVLDDMDADTRQGVKLLTTAAAVRRDPAALEAINSFVTDQRLDLGSVLDRVAKANRARTLESLDLLDSVSKRSEALRRTLSCGGSPSAGADRLGPKPRECTGGLTSDEGTDKRAVHDRARGTAIRPDQRNETGGAPAGSDETQAAVDRGPGTAVVDPATATGEPVDEPDTQPATTRSAGDDVADDDPNVMGDVGRVLGGLLG